MTSFIDGHRDSYGIEPICAVLPTCLLADRSGTFHWRSLKRYTTRSSRLR